jgi:hypothetical protein
MTPPVEMTNDQIPMIKEVPMTYRMPMRVIRCFHSLVIGIWSLVILLGLPACNSFKVDLASPDPIKVDVNMRLDVYQYKGDEPGKKGEAEIGYEEAVQRQRNRMGEIQKLKDNRFVGEDHRGLLHLREKPAGDWGDYVERTVEQENDDRTILMRHEAKESNRALHEVQDEQWKRRTTASYAGEWVELPGDKPNTYKWAQSTGPRPNMPVVKGNEAKAVPTGPPPAKAKETITPVQKQAKPKG